MKNCFLKTACKAQIVRLGQTNSEYRYMVQVFRLDRAVGISIDQVCAVFDLGSDNNECC